MRQKYVTNIISRLAKSSMKMVVKFISMVFFFFFCSEPSNLTSCAGANLNAQIGLTNPATCGGDVCHMNLHKTFAM
jgi:hypothetical protein